MARHPQPREVAELKGATKHDPQRYRKQPPAVDQPIGSAPAHMTEAARKVWFELETYAPRGVLTGADRVALEMLSNLLSEYREDPVAFKVGKYPALIGCLARLGMTPADRQKLGVEKPKDDDVAFDEF
jgi:phage terminase small subunit